METDNPSAASTLHLSNSKKPILPTLPCLPVNVVSSKPNDLPSDEQPTSKPDSPTKLSAEPPIDAFPRNDKEPEKPKRARKLERNYSGNDAMHAIAKQSSSPTHTPLSESREIEREKHGANEQLSPRLETQTEHDHRQLAGSSNRISSNNSPSDSVTTAQSAPILLVLASEGDRGERHTIEHEMPARDNREHSKERDEKREKAQSLPSSSAASSASANASPDGSPSLNRPSASGATGDDASAKITTHVGDKRLRVKHKSDQRIKLSRSKSGNAKDSEEKELKEPAGTSQPEANLVPIDAGAVTRALSASSLSSKSKSRVTERSNSNSGQSSPSLDSLDLVPAKQLQRQPRSQPNSPTSAPRNPWDGTDSAGSLTGDDSLLTPPVSGVSTPTQPDDTVSILDYILDKISSDETRRDSLTLFNSLVDFELTGSLATQAIVTDSANPIALPNSSASVASSSASGSLSPTHMAQQTSSTSVLGARNQASHLMFSGRHRDHIRERANRRMPLERERSNDLPASHNSALTANDNPNAVGPMVVGGQRTLHNASLALTSPPVSPRESRVRKLEEGAALMEQSKEDAFAMVQKLCKYAAEGDIVGLKKILIHYPFLAHHRNFRGQTCLQCACQEGHVAVVIEILKPYPVAELDLQDPNGCTALHAAVHSRKKNLTALLLYKGAKPTIANAQGINPRQDAASVSLELLDVFLTFEKEGSSGIATHFPVVSCLAPVTNYTLQYFQSQQYIPEFISFLTVWDDKIHEYTTFYWNTHCYKRADSDVKSGLWKTLCGQYEKLRTDFKSQLKEVDSMSCDSGWDILTSVEKLCNILVKVIESDIYPFYSFLELKENTDISDPIYTINLPYGGKKRIVMTPTTNLLEEIAKICEMRNWKMSDFNIVNEEGVHLTAKDKQSDRKRFQSNRVFVEVKKNLSPEVVSGGVISPKTGVPSTLFVVILTDGTKKTLSCSTDENVLTLPTFLKRKREMNAFQDDFNCALDSKGIEIPPEVLVKEIPDRCVVLERKEVDSVGHRKGKLIHLSKRDSQKKNVPESLRPKGDKPEAGESDKVMVRDPSLNHLHLENANINRGSQGKPKDGKLKKGKLEGLFMNASKQELKFSQAAEGDKFEKADKKKEKDKFEGKIVPPTAKVYENVFGTSNTLNDFVAYSVMNNTESAALCQTRFLLAYPQWLSGPVLLQRILSMFTWCEKSSKPRILGFIEKWLTHHYIDFNTAMLTDLRKFLDDDNNDLDQELPTVALLVQLIEGGDREKKSVSSKSKPLHTLESTVSNTSHPAISGGESDRLTRGESGVVVSKAVKNLRAIISTRPNAFHSIAFLQFDVLELAQQMTLYDQAQLQEIPRDEFLSRNYSIPDQSPCMQTLTATFNLRTQWILSELITAESTDAKYILTNYIMLAEKLFLFGNMHGFLSIIMGLSQGFASRLIAWKILSNSTRARWEKLSEICNPDKNFRNLRAAFELLAKPKISSPSLFIKDLTMLDEGAKNWIEENEKINLDKFNIFSDIIYSVCDSVQTSYPFTPIPVIQDYLKNLFALDPTSLETLYDRRKIYENSLSDV